MFSIPETFGEATLSVFVWTLIWTLYFFCGMSSIDYFFQDNQYYLQIVRKGMRCELNDRVLATTHAVLCIIFVILSFIYDGVSSSLDIPQGRLDIMFSFICPSMGYFIVDGAVVVYMAARSDNRFLVLLEVVHHLLCLWSEGVFLLTLIVPEGVRLAFITEITTPILHLRWILIQFGAPKKTITTVSLCILGGFIIFRDINMIVLAGILISVGSDKLSEVSVIGCFTVIMFVFLLSILNYYWTFLMMQKCLSVFSKKPSKDDPENSLIGSRDIVLGV
eukprot:c28408_g1_i1.p1 GENE.c28408_g1_i1~~c28408_g1_i1.p1  ORF type:complete len:277 (+),score=79.45 c28408_g1_i1:41-871(+)